MSDSMEKFVLQYSVELRDSITRLEQLNNRIGETNKKAGEGKKALQDFGKGALGEADKLVPGLGNVTNALGGITKAAGVAALGIAAITFAVKALMKANDDLMKQRTTGFNVGMSTIQVEQMQREMFKASGGMVDAQGSRDLMEKTRSLAVAAYTDPNPTNATARKLQKAGVASVFGGDGKLKDSQSIMDELSDAWSKMSLEMAQAKGALLGFNQDEVNAIRNRTQAVRDAAKLTDEEIIKKYEQTQATVRYNGQLAEFQEKTRLLGQNIATVLLPALNKFLGWVLDIPGKLEKLSDDMYGKETTAGGNIKSNSWLGKGWDAAAEFITGEKPKHQNTGTRTEKEEKEQTHKKAMEILKQQNNSAETQAKTAAEMQRSINLFGASVSTFSSAISQQQAMAIWAGTIGQATGMPSGAPQPVGGYSPPAGGGKLTPNKYDPLIESVWGQYADVGKALMRVESGGDPNAKNKKSTASGLFQVLKQSWDGKNPFDPQQSTEMAYKLFQEKMRMSHGDVRKAIKIYGENTDEYVNKVYKYMPGGSGRVQDATHGFGGGTGIRTETRQTHQGADARAALAKVLGIDVQQLASGTVSSADIKAGFGKLEMDAVNAYQTAKAKATDPGTGWTDQQRKQAQLEWQQAGQQLRALEENKSSILGMGNGSQERELTSSSPQFNIYIQSTPEAADIARRVKEAVQDINQNVQNQNNSSRNI